MTLHWWMHWFWVTAQIAVALMLPVATTTEQSTGAEPMTTATLPIARSNSGLEQTTAEALAKLQQSYRIAKAIGLRAPTDEQPDSLRVLVTTDSAGSLHVVGSAASSSRLGPRSSAENATFNGKTFSANNSNATVSRTVQAGRIPGKKEAKITWVQAFSKTPRPKTLSSTASPLAAASATSEEAPTPDEALTVMPLEEEQYLDRIRASDPNGIRREQQPLLTVNRSPIADSGQDIVEPHVAATTTSILDAGMGDSSRLGRARGTFTNKFSHEQLTRDERQQQRGKDGETTRKDSSESGANVTEIVTITGSCLAVVVLLSTVGSLGFIVYRRRYLNPPQTLNSDKCSNPDSSGYIDDSTMRDNSEEMYSLDNDSFLNSLEAMTIQNYWTDSVKHTKL